MKNVQISEELYFKLSEKEMELIHQKKALAGVRNTSAYLRKMAIDGYFISLEIPELKEVSRLLNITSNNVNQIAKLANSTGNINQDDVRDLKFNMDKIKVQFGEILAHLSKIKG